MPDYTVKADINTLLRADDFPDARTKLGLGSAATSNQEDFATGAEGDLAGTALQPAAIGVTVGAHVDAASNAEAIAGTEAGLRTFSPLRIAEAITALGSGGITVGDTTEINLTLAAGEITADINAASIAIGKLDGSINTSLGKADTALQAAAIGVTVGAHLDAASNAEAIAGTEAGLRTFSPLRIAEAITALGSGAITVGDTTEINLTLAAGEITADINAASIAIGKLDGSINTSLGKADTALQAAAIGDTVQGFDTILENTTASYTTEEQTKLAGIWGGENKVDATTGPTANSDSANTDTNGTFSVGSVWVDTTANEAYRCVDSTPTAAVWVNTTLGTDDLAQIATSGSASDLTTGTLSIARIAAGSITENELNATTNSSLDLADTASQPGHMHTQVDISDLSSASTGVLTGGILRLGATSTRFSIDDGTGIIVDEFGAVTEVVWSGLLNREPTNLNAQQITFLSINAAGQILEQSGPWTPQQRREQICIGVAVHVDFTNVVAVNNEQSIAFNPMSSTYDIGGALGFLNLDGNVFSPDAQTATMAIAKSEGEIFKMGANYNVNTKSPHNKILPQLDPVIFGYRYSAGNTDANQTVIDPNNLDDGANGLTPISGNANANIWSIQRIYSFISNNVFIQRGVEEFGSQADAIAGVGSENYMVESSIEANGLFRGYLIVKKGETDLNSADTTFIAASKFGASGGGASGASPHTPEGTAVQSTGETEGLKFLREDGDGTSSWQKVIETIGMACSDETTAPLVSGEAVVFDMPYDFEITRVYATLTAVGGTTAVSLNLKDEAQNILAASLGIQPGTNNAEVSGAVFFGGASSYPLSKGDRIAVDIILPDTSNTGAGLKVFIEGTRN